jgi:hypothetical protein
MKPNKVSSSARKARIVVKTAAKVANVKTTLQKSLNEKPVHFISILSEANELLNFDKAVKSKSLANQPEKAEDLKNPSKGPSQKPTGSSSQEEMDSTRRLMLYKVITSHGLQTPVLRLPRLITSLTSDGFGEMTETIVVTLGTLSNASDLAALFDEYRILRAEAQYVSWFTNTDVSSTQTNRNLGGFVDYSSSTDPADLQDVWDHTDTAKIRCSNENFSLHAESRGTPDLEWTDVSSSSISPFYFKYYCATIPTTTTIGVVCVWVDVQFRSIN